MDVVILSHIPTSNGIDFVRFKKVIEALVRAMEPAFVDVAFAIGTENPDGINAFQIKTIINKGTKDQLEDSLKRIFKQHFEISCNGENNFPQDLEDILKVTAQFL